MKYSVILFVLALAACDGDASSQGIRSACAGPSASLADCQTSSLLTPEDACWWLVECGAIPVANPDDNEDNGFDWAFCVGQLQSMSESRFHAVSTCLQTASCDELTSGNAPARPTRFDEAFPLCFQFGDPR